ncbi:hypothetical protein SAMN05216412_101337 [Nitrosospira multiformis]|uniref:Uncharacterized protein n=1 Tax=Nitrosospira multiformis TaxID=1231 RepID=A0A1H9YQ95_9PROT|nr:hypothetical protein SAMN05216412_101337 [Nitrosospira multiformis]
MNIPSYIEKTLPPSPERDRVMNLVRLGLSFEQQQRLGKRPGFLKDYLLKLLTRIGNPLTFERLLEELELEAVRRDMHGSASSPIEKVDRVWQLITYHHPRNGRQQLTFKTIRNKFTWCKLNLNK